MVINFFYMLEDQTTLQNLESVSQFKKFYLLLQTTKTWSGYVAVRIVDQQIILEKTQMKHKGLTCKGNETNQRKEKKKLILLQKLMQ